MKRYPFVLSLVLLVAQSVGLGAVPERITLEGHPGEVRAVAFSPDGKLLACGGMGPSDDPHGRGAVTWWDVATGKRRGTLVGNPGVVHEIAFSPDGKTLVSASHRGREISDYEEAGNVKVWEVPTGRELRTLHGQAEGVTALAFSAQGEALASGSFDGTLILRDPSRDWQTWATLRLPRGSEWREGIHALAFDSNSKWLAVACQGGTVELWDVNRVEKKHTLRVHRKEGYGSSIAFSPDGKTLAVGVPEGIVQLWDIETFKIRNTLKAHSTGVPLPVFSPDGRMLATAAGDWDQPGKVTLWNPATGEQLTTFTAHEKMISCLAFSSDAKLLASGSYDQTVKLWDVADVAGRKSGN